MHLQLALMQMFSTKTSICFHSTLMVVEADSGVNLTVAWTCMTAFIKHANSNRITLCMTSRQIIVISLNRCLNGSTVILGNFICECDVLDLKKTESVL